MYRRIFINNNAAISSPDRGDVTFYFNESVTIQDDEVLEMRLSEAFFHLNADGNFTAYVCIDKLTDNYNFIQNIDNGVQSTILGKVTGYSTGTYIIYQDPTNFRTRIYDKILNGLHITLFDSSWTRIIPDNDWEIVIDLIITKKDVYENRSI